MEMYNFLHNLWKCIIFYIIYRNVQFSIHYISNCTIFYINIVICMDYVWGPSWAPPPPTGKSATGYTFSLYIIFCLFCCKNHGKDSLRASKKKQVIQTLN